MVCSETERAADHVRAPAEHRAVDPVRGQHDQRTPRAILVRRRHHSDPRDPSGVAESPEDGAEEGPGEWTRQALWKERLRQPEEAASDAAEREVRTERERVLFATVHGDLAHPPQEVAHELSGRRLAEMTESLRGEHREGHRSGPEEPADNSACNGSHEIFHAEKERKARARWCSSCSFCRREVRLMSGDKKVSTHDELGGVSHPDESIWDEGAGRSIAPPPDAAPRRKERKREQVSESEKKKMLLS
jgi:hypothetical protein